MTSCSTVSTQLDGVSYFQDRMHEAGIHGEPDSAHACVTRRGYYIPKKNGTSELRLHF